MNVPIVVQGFQQLLANVTIHVHLKSHISYLGVQNMYTIISLNYHLITI